jgi:hypothetical protein
MPQATPIRLGSVTYYGYPSLSEAFHDLDEQAQAVYMTLMVSQFGKEVQDPIVMIDVGAYADALGTSRTNVYSILSSITGVVVMNDVEGGGTLYTNLAISVQEMFDRGRSPVSVVLLVPILEDHTSLIEALDDLALTLGGHA